MNKMLLTEGIEIFLKDCEERRESPKTTISTYRSVFNLFVKFISEEGDLYIHEVTEDHARTYKNSLNRHANSTIRKYVMALRSLFSYAVQKKWAPDNPFQYLIVKKGVLKPKSVLPREDFDKLLYYAPDATLYSIFLMGGDAGLRIGEVLKLEIKDLDFENKLIHVNGKGNKDRLLPMTIRIAKEVKYYIEKERKESDSPLLFLMPKGTPVKPNHVNKKFKETAQEHLGLNITFHKLRHCFATAIYNQKRDIMVVKELLGHERVETTECYLNVTERNKRMAIERLDE